MNTSVTNTDLDPDAREIPRIISVDDHVVEPPHLFDRYLPNKLKDKAPRVERHILKSLTLEGGSFEIAIDDDSAGTPTDFWHYEDKMLPLRRANACAGVPYESVMFTGITFDEMRVGYYDPKARLADMDLNWVEASLSFPTFPRFCGQTFLEARDRELALACVMAYNDWMVEEWCGDSQGRLLPLCLIPLWDPQLAASETRRNADRGVHAVCFTEGPDKLGLPSLHDKNHFWDPFLDACHETGTVICMHIGSSSQLHLPSPDAPLASVGATVSNNSIDALTDWLFSGALVRYPNLKIALAESQVGWIPYVLERCDHVWNTQRGMSEAVRSLPEPPSYYYYRQVFGCLYDDQFGLDNLDKVGEDNVTFETDYPHLDGTWPKSRQMADSLTKKLSPGQTYKLLRGNAINLFNLPLDGKDSKYVSIDTGVDQTKMGGAANAK